jgi:hypothetical protein
MMRIKGTQNQIIILPVAGFCLLLQLLFCAPYCPAQSGGGESFTYKAPEVPLKSILKSRHQSPKAKAPDPEPGEEAQPKPQERRIEPVVADQKQEIPPFPFPIPKSEFTERSDGASKEPETVVEKLPKIAAPFAPEDAIAAPAPKKEIIKETGNDLKPPKMLESRRAKESLKAKPMASEQIPQGQGPDSMAQMEKGRDPKASAPVELLPAPGDEFDPEPVPKPKEEERAEQVKDVPTPAAPQAKEPVPKKEETEEKAKEQEPQEAKSPPTLNWTAPDPSEKVRAAETGADTPEHARMAPAPSTGSPITRSAPDEPSPAPEEAIDEPKENTQPPKSPPTLNWTAPDKPVESMEPDAPKEEVAPEPMTPIPSEDPEEAQTPAVIEEQSIADEPSPPEIEPEPEAAPPPPAPAREMVPSPLAPDAIEDEEAREYLIKTSQILEELSLLMTRAPSLSLAQYDPSDSSAPLAPPEVMRQIESLSRRLRILDSKTFTVIPPNRYNDFHNMLRNSIAESRMAFESVMNFFSQGDPGALQEMQDHITKARELIRETRRTS